MDTFGQSSSDPRRHILDILRFGPKKSWTKVLKIFLKNYLNTKGFVIENGVSNFAHGVEMGVARRVFLPVELDLEVFRRHTGQITLIFGRVDIWRWFWNFEYFDF